MEVEEEMYVVERILGKGKDAAGNTIYRVKWAGYPDEEATWEPQINLDNKDVEGYENQLNSKPLSGGGPVSASEDSVQGLQYQHPEE